MSVRLVEIGAKSFGYKRCFFGQNSQFIYFGQEIPRRLAPQTPLFIPSPKLQEGGGDPDSPPWFGPRHPPPPLSFRSRDTVPDPQEPDPQPRGHEVPDPAHRRGRGRRGLDSSLGLLSKREPIESVRQGARGGGGEGQWHPESHPAPSCGCPIPGLVEGEGGGVPPIAHQPNGPLLQFPREVCPPSPHPLRTPCCRGGDRGAVVPVHDLPRAPRQRLGDLDQGLRQRLPRHEEALRSAPGGLRLWLRGGWGGVATPPPHTLPPSASLCHPFTPLLARPPRPPHLPHRRDHHPVLRPGVSPQAPPRPPLSPPCPRSCPPFPRGQGPPIPIRPAFGRPCARALIPRSATGIACPPCMVAEAAPGAAGPAAGPHVPRR